MLAETNDSTVFVSHTAGIDVNLSLRGDKYKNTLVPVSVRDFRESSICVYSENGILPPSIGNLDKKVRKNSYFAFRFVIFTIRSLSFVISNHVFIEESECQHLN